MTTEHAHVEEHNHPGPRQYVIIGAILAIITLIEFGVFYLELDPAFMTWVILLLSTSKFLLVVGYFMHLKFDDVRFSGSSSPPSSSWSASPSSSWRSSSTSPDSAPAPMNTNRPPRNTGGTP